MQWVKSGDLKENYDVFEKIGEDGKIHRNFITRAKSSKAAAFKNNVALNTVSHAEIYDHERLKTFERRTESSIGRLDKNSSKNLIGRQKPIIPRMENYFKTQQPLKRSLYNRDFIKSKLETSESRVSNFVFST